MLRGWHQLYFQCCIVHLNGSVIDLPRFLWGTDSRLRCNFADFWAYHCSLYWSLFFRGQVHTPHAASCNYSFAQRGTLIAWSTDPNLVAGVAHLPDLDPANSDVTLQWTASGLPIELLHDQWDKQDLASCCTNGHRCAIRTALGSATPGFVVYILIVSLLGLEVVHLWGTHRSWRRFHRRLTGASTLTRTKNGRLKRFSKTFSFHTSVVTQRCCHFFVTKSSRDSTQAKEFSFASCCSKFGSWDDCWAKSSLTNPRFSVR